MQGYFRLSLALWCMGLLVCWLSACANPAAKSKTLMPAATEPHATTEVYVLSHGWHTGWVLPAAAIEQRLPQLQQRFSSSPYLEFGWGDKGFYQAKEITTGLTLQAMFWSTGAVMHVAAVTETPYAYFPNSQVVALCLTPSDYAALVSFIAESFSVDPQGKLQPLKLGIYGDSQFYAAQGRYHGFNTCNKWTATGLNRAGFDINPRFKLTAGSVLSWLQQSQAAQQRCHSLD